MTITAPAYNTFEGWTNGQTITAPGSGGVSGTQFDAIYGTSFTASAADAQSGAMGAVIAASGFGGGQWNLSSVSSCAAYLMFDMKTLSTGDAHLVHFEDGTGRIFSVHVNGAGKLRVDDATGTTGVFTFSTVLTAGQYYFLRVFATAGSTTSNGVIKVAYYVGTSQTPAETPYTSTTANLGAGRLFTKGMLGKLTASAEAYGVDRFGMDPTASDYMPFPADLTVASKPAMVLGEFALPPAVTAGAGKTVVAKPAGASAGAVPATISATTDIVGTAIPGGYGGVHSPTVTTGTGVTVLPSPTFLHGSGSMPPPRVSAAANALILPAMTISAMGAPVAPRVVLNSTGPAALSGSGSLAGAGVPAVPVTASLAGAGALTVTAVPAWSATAALSGAGGLSAIVLPANAAPAVFGGTGSLTVGSTVPAVPTTAGLSGLGALTATTQLATTATAALSGGGVLAATGTPAPGTTAALTGGGSLAGGGTLTFADVATFGGSGVLSGVLVEVDAAVPAGLGGDGTLTAATMGNHSGGASFTGAGQVSASTALTVSTGANLSGAGSVTVGKFPVIPSTAALSGSGALTGAVFPAMPRTAALSGVGTVSALTGTAFTGPAVFTSEGVLTVISNPAFLSTATLSGVGYVAAGGGPAWGAGATFAGSGVLTATQPRIIVTATLTRRRWAGLLWFRGV